MRIENYTPEYARKIAELFTASVHAIGAEYYTPAQKSAWAPQPPDYEGWQRRLAAKRPLLALAGDVLAGFIELEKDGYINCFYVHPDRQGEGVGTALFDHAETAAAARKTPRLYADVSLAAKQFFLKRGFEILAENHVARRKEILVNYTMQRLSANIIINLCADNAALPLDLFLLADPSLEKIETYLQGANVYLLRQDNAVLCGYILTPYGGAALELKNIAVREECQGRGFGKLLLAHAAREARQRGFKELVIGTGNSSLPQLALYQKSGFEPFEIRRDFFVSNYPEPIWENGIQCKHMIMLRKSL